MKKQASEPPAPIMADDEKDHREDASAPPALQLLPPPEQSLSPAVVSADLSNPAEANVDASSDGASLSARLIQQLAQRFAHTLCDDLDQLSHAETQVESKSGHLINKPEWAIRMKATELKFAYLIGRPIQRQQVLQAQVQPGYEALVAEARRSPAFRTTLHELLTELDDAASRE